MACTGPDNTAFDGKDCVSSPHQTSCDGTQTCHYADFEIQGLTASPQWLGGNFIDGSQSGDFKIDLVPKPLAAIGIKSGDVVSLLNGRVPNARAIQSFTPEDPARRAEVTRSTLDGRIKLSLYRK